MAKTVCHVHGNVGGYGHGHRETREKGGAIRWIIVNDETKELFHQVKQILYLLPTAVYWFLFGKTKHTL